MIFKKKKSGFFVNMRAEILQTDHLLIQHNVISPVRNLTYQRLERTSEWWSRWKTYPELRDHFCCESRAAETLREHSRLLKPNCSLRENTLFLLSHCRRGKKNHITIQMCSFKEAFLKTSPRHTAQRNS